MRYQLFQQIPDENFIITLLNCFGINNLDDTKEFSKLAEKIKEHIPDLESRQDGEFPTAAVFSLQRHQQFRNPIPIQTHHHGASPKQMDRSRLST